MMFCASIPTSIQMKKKNTVKKQNKINLKSIIREAKKL